MSADPVLDGLFRWCAWTAMIGEARAVQKWPDSERVRGKAYRLYEEETARKGRESAD